jgi:hypothetical protein
MAFNNFKAILVELQFKIKAKPINMMHFKFLSLL